MFSTHQVIEQNIRDIEDNHEDFIIFLRQYMKRNKFILRAYRLKKLSEIQNEEKKAPNK